MKAQVFYILLTQRQIFKKWSWAVILQALWWSFKVFLQTMAAFSLLFNPVLVPGHFQPYVCLLSHFHEICCSHLVKYIIHELKRHKISFLHHECESQLLAENVTWHAWMVCSVFLKNLRNLDNENSRWTVSVLTEIEKNTAMTQSQRDPFSLSGDPSTVCGWMAVKESFWSLYFRSETKF